MDRDASLEAARAAFDRRAWEQAWSVLSAADASAPLEREHLERLAAAALLTGRDEDSDDAWLRAYRLGLESQDLEQATRCLFWLTFRLLNSGRIEQANGWITKAGRLLTDTRPDDLPHGRLAYLTGLQAAFQSDEERAADRFERAAALGGRHGDVDLRVLGQTGLARMLIRLHRQADGVGLLDEVMADLAAGDVSAIVVGDVYCTAIDACHELYDVRRAQEWTAALTRWCDAQPELVPYRGQCLVHRSELLQLGGDWSAAMEQARSARVQLSQPTRQLALGAACYQQGELHRLRGELAAAEQAYGLASRHGRDPQPGLALLRMNEQRTDVAAAMSRRLTGEAASWATRAQLLPAHVEIMLAAGDVGAARDAADELSASLTGRTSRLFEATTAHALGSVLLAEGDPSSALAALRRAHEAWCAIDAPYHAARTRVAIAAACAALGDADSAAVERSAAAAVFEELGAVVDLRALSGDPHTDHPLTGREVQVLRLVAGGRTNRAIGAELVLSERTVERHLSNIFAKLGVSTRSAATAYAFEHHLV